jgi:hypothetical protein
LPRVGAYVIYTFRSVSHLAWHKTADGRVLRV